jgi:hypothetical protein
VSARGRNRVGFRRVRLALANGTNTAWPPRTEGLVYADFVKKKRGGGPTPDQGGWCPTAHRGEKRERYSIIRLVTVTSAGGKDNGGAEQAKDGPGEGHTFPVQGLGHILKPDTDSGVPSDFKRPS